MLFLEQKIITAGKAAIIPSLSKQRELSCGRFPWSSSINGSLFPEWTWLTEQKPPGSYWCFAASRPQAKPLILLIRIYLSLYPGNKQQITPKQSNDSTGRAHKTPWALRFVWSVPARQSWIIPFSKERKGSGEQEEGEKEQLYSLPWKRSCQSITFFHPSAFFWPGEWELKSKRERWSRTGQMWGVGMGQGQAGSAQAWLPSVRGQRLLPAQPLLFQP